jgi:hypothetical protein
MSKENQIVLGVVAALFVLLILLRGGKASPPFNMAMADPFLSLKGIAVTKEKNPLCATSWD